VQAMSRRTELNREWGTDARELRERGFGICGHCGQRFPLPAGRCRRRTCSGYAPLWARDTMRKIRENLLTYGGLVAMVTVTAPGEREGLVWDTSRCTHPPGERCTGPKGCRVVQEAAERWNRYSRSQWSELNRIAKQHADRAVRRLGYKGGGGLLIYEWELQKRGVWHNHVVLGMETAVERAWAYEYVRALRAVGPSKFFGFVDERPLRNPQPATQVAGYLSKYLAKWREDGTLEVSETVLSAGRGLLNYVSLKLTAKSGCTMRSLRMVRVAWAFREGLIPQPMCDPFELLLALFELEGRELAVRGP
jgi:ribosomal protein L40E